MPNTGPFEALLSLIVWLLITGFVVMIVMAIVRSRRAGPGALLPAGVAASIELTIYDDGRTAIAVSETGGPARPRSIRHAASHQLDDLDELREHVAAAIDDVAARRVTY